MEIDIPIYPLKIAIEWDGEYWHYEIKDTKRKDDTKNKLLSEKGRDVIRIISPSHPALSKDQLQDRLNLLVSLIIEITKNRN